MLPKWGTRVSSSQSTYVLDVYWDTKCVMFVWGGSKYQESHFLELSRVKDLGRVFLDHTTSGSCSYILFTMSATFLKVLLPFIAYTVTHVPFNFISWPSHCLGLFFYLSYLSQGFFKTWVQRQVSTRVPWILRIMCKVLRVCAFFWASGEEKAAYATSWKFSRAEQSAVLRGGQSANVSSYWVYLLPHFNRPALYSCSLGLHSLIKSNTRAALGLLSGKAGPQKKKL